MMPAAFVFLDALPLLPTGKVDRRALPVPSQARPALDIAYAAPRTPIESTLVHIWAEVLNLASVGIHDPFLELGGDSLRATRILTRVVENFRIPLALAALLEAQTVARMAEIIVLHCMAQTDPATVERLLAEAQRRVRAATQPATGRATTP